MKQNRALKVIDRNSLPIVVDILEVPKAKESKTLNESNKLDRSVGNPGSSAISSRQERDRQSMALSKTPKRSNLRRNRNVNVRNYLDQKTGFLFVTNYKLMENNIKRTAALLCLIFYILKKTEVA